MYLSLELFVVSVLFTNLFSSKKSTFENMRGERTRFAVYSVLLTRVYFNLCFIMNQKLIYENRCDERLKN